MKKILAFCLLFVMCFALLGTTAFADNDEMIPVYAKVPEGWDGPCVWAWADDGTNAFAAWPGEELEGRMKREVVHQMSGDILYA